LAWLPLCKQPENRIGMVFSRAPGGRVFVLATTHPHCLVTGAGSVLQATEEHTVTQSSFLTRIGPSRQAMWTVIKIAANDWLRHHDARLGAALAYYSVFSLGSLLLIVVPTFKNAFDRQVDTLKRRPVRRVPFFV
jgi:hypothetical protein